MKIYRYNHDGYFVCEDIAQLDPLDGKYLVPELSTTIEPPTINVNEKLRFVYGAWKIIKNYVGQIFYHKQTGEKYICQTIGEDPTIDYTEKTPQPFSKFNDDLNDWVIDVDKVRKNKLDLIRWIRKPYLEEIDLFVNDLTLDDCKYTKQQVRIYRKEWLNITEPFKQNPELLDSFAIDSLVKPVIGEK